MDVYHFVNSANAFNQNISGWCVTNIPSESHCFYRNLTSVNHQFGAQPTVIQSTLQHKIVQTINYQETTETDKSQEMIQA